MKDVRPPEEPDDDQDEDEGRRRGGLGAPKQTVRANLPAGRAWRTTRLNRAEQTSTLRGRRSCGVRSTTTTRRANRTPYGALIGSAVSTSCHRGSGVRFA